MARRPLAQREPLDRWTLVHAATGAAMGAAGVPAAWALAAAVAYELAEQIAERQPAVQRFFVTSGPEHAANVAADLAIYMAAWYAAQRLRR